MVYVSKTFQWEIFQINFWKPQNVFHCALAFLDVFYESHIKVFPIMFIIDRQKSFCRYNSQISHVASVLFTANKKLINWADMMVFTQIKIEFLFLFSNSYYSDFRYFHFINAISLSFPKILEGNNTYPLKIKELLKPLRYEGYFMKCANLILISNEN